MFNNNDDLDLLSCVFEDNTARGDSGGNVYGGAVLVDSDNNFMTLQNCSLFGNLVRGEGGSSRAYGGALCVYIANPDLTLENCVFTDNTAMGVGGGSAYGGGVYLATNNDDMTLLNCFFMGNTARGEIGGVVYGGGAYVDSNNDGVSLLNCAFSENSAGSGGALYFNSANSYAVLWNVTCRSNFADADGDALALISTNYHMNINQCTFSDNQAGIAGMGPTFFVCKMLFLFTVIFIFMQLCSNTVCLCCVDVCLFVCLFVLLFSLS